MTHQKNDTQEETESQVSFEEMLREQLQQAIRKCSHRASGTELLKSDIISTGYGLPSISDFNRSEEHTSELQSHSDLVCRLLLEKKKKYIKRQSRVVIT